MRVAREVLDVVELRELAVDVRDGEALELLQRLPAEVRAVDEEEDATRSAVLDQPVGEARGHVGLPGSGRHLHERPRVVLGQRTLEVLDRALLRGPEVGVVERRKPGEAVAERRRFRRARHFFDPGGERLRLVKGEDVPARRLGIERVREPRLGACGLVGERKRTLERGRDPVRDPVDVLRGLPGDARERLALLLRLEHTDGLPVDEEEVVGAAVRRRRGRTP